MENKEYPSGIDLLWISTTPTRDDIQKLFENDNIDVIYQLMDKLKQAKDTIRLIKENWKKLPKWFKSENALYMLFLVGWPIITFSGFRKKHLLSKREMTNIESHLLKTTGILSISMYITLAVSYMWDESVNELESHNPIEMYKYFSSLLERYSPVVFIKTVVMVLYNIYIITILRPNVLRLLKESNEVSHPKII